MKNNDNFKNEGFDSTTHKITPCCGVPLLVIVKKIFAITYNYIYCKECKKAYTKVGDTPKIFFKQQDEVKIQEIIKLISDNGRN